MNTENQNQQNTPKQEVTLSIDEKNIVDGVLRRINAFKQNGDLKMNYINALILLLVILLNNSAEKVRQLH